MLKQGLQQKLLQKLSPQQIQLMKLLQIPAIALEQRIEEEIQENPALEEGEEIDEEINESEEDEYDGEAEEVPVDENDNFELDLDDYMQDDDIPDYKLSVNNTGKDEEQREMPIALAHSFQDNLIVQLGMCVFDNNKYHIAEHLIGSIDDDGYLRRPLGDIVDDLSFGQNIVTTEEALLDILKIIQTFDPVGVGARDLQECLLLQLKRKAQTNPFVKLATDIIQDYMEEFSRKHYDKIKKQLNIRDEDLKEAMNEILHLNPRPGNSYADNQKSLQHVIPDFIITNNEDVLELTLNSKNAPDLRVSKSYINMLNTYAKDKKSKSLPSNKEAIQFVKHKIDSAKFFIDAINQRNQTLYLTMSAILNYQYEYFLEGDETKLKPMILKDIADRVGLDISTISRVASSKYAQTPFGTISLKSLFSEGMQTDSGEEVSSREVKKILSDCISAESKSKPLTDDEVAAILKEKGYSIARRTVSKYREQLEIPVARMRKEL
jgi:RNA polymerase sigma-54 factor